MNPFAAILLLLALITAAIGLYFWGAASALESIVSPIHPASSLYREAAKGMFQLALILGILAGALAALGWGGVL